MPLYLEPPYDRGFPWQLVSGETKAVLSEFTAVSLAARYDIPIGVNGRPGGVKEGPLGLNPEVYTEELRLSKKARRMLEAAGVKLPVASTSHRSV